MAITGLEYFRLRSSADGQSVYGVVVTTVTKLYQFQATIGRPDERPLLLPLFHAYLNTKGYSGDSIFSNELRSDQL